MFKNHPIIKEAILWTLMPILTVLGSLLGVLAVGTLWWIFFKMHSEEIQTGWMFKYLIPIFGCCIYGYLWAQIPAKIAPRGKAIASIIMVTILSAANLVIITILLVSDQIATYNPTFDIILSLAIITSSILSSIQVYKKNHNNNNNYNWFE